MNVEELIARKQAERIAAGLAIRITFEGRDPFTAYYRSVEERDRNLAIARSRIGVLGPDGTTIKTVDVIQ